MPPIVPEEKNENCPYFSSLSDKFMAYSPTNLEIQGSFMRVPPPKELSKSIERRRSSDESQKPVSRRSTTVNTRPVAPPTRKVHLTTTNKVETKATPIKSDENETMKTKIANLEDEIRRLKKRIEELEKEVADLQKQLKTKDKKINDLTKENDELKKREFNFEKQLEEFRTENRRLNDENRQLQNEIDRLESLHKSQRNSQSELDALREHVKVKK